MNKIEIPEPCHMKWSDLDEIESSKNRHCTKCSIEIVDFTKMTNDEIITYLSNRKKERVCGRVYSVSKNSKYIRLQKKLISWHDTVKLNVTSRHLRAPILALLGLALATSSCIGQPSEEPCRLELVPDTTTEAPNDSTYVETCN